MKRSGIILLVAALLFHAGNISATGQKDEKEKRSSGNDDYTEVVVGKNFLKITENDSSVNVRIRNRGLTILESLEGEGTEVRIERYGCNEESNKHDYSEYDYNERERRRNSFRGHWSAVEFGFNNYTASRDNHFIPDEIAYMTLHSGKSHNFNINFAQLNLGFSRHLGIITGLGLNWNNYRFDNNNNIIKGLDGMIQTLDPGAELRKSKFATLFMTIPLLLELQIPANSNTLNLAAGPIGGVKLFSHSKMVFDDRHREKSGSDFNLNLLRYGWTARVGYSNLQLYGTYYVVPLFRTARGPSGYDLYPFEVGVSLSFND